jgi:hypothetical protein
MKKAYKPVPKSQRTDVTRLGALVAIVAGVLLFAGAAFAFWQNSSSNSPSASFTPEAKGAPRLKADKQKVDLGNVKLGQTVQVSFDITNTGDQPLRFAKDPFVEVVEGC